MDNNHIRFAKIDKRTPKAIRERAKKLSEEYDYGPDGITHWAYGLQSDEVVFAGLMLHQEKPRKGYHYWWLLLACNDSRESGDEYQWQGTAQELEETGIKARMALF